jgi:hypothetical protein
VHRTESLLRRVDGWVFAPEDARRLAAGRIGLCGLLGVRLATTNYRLVAGHRVLFHPVSYMRLFEHVPSRDVVSTLQIGGVVAAFVAAAGLALGVSLPLAFLCSLVLNGIRNSAGRVIVGDAALMLCLLVLLACVSAAGEAWSIREPFLRARRRFRRDPRPLPSIAANPSSSGKRYGWPIRTAMIAVALVYFFAGFQKWRYSGVAWVTSDNLRWILYGQAHPDGLALYVADRPVLAHLFAAGSLLLETCFPLVLFVPRLRWLFIPAVVAMHIGIRLSLGLDYSAQWLTLVIVFVNWPVVVGWAREAVARVPLLREAPG